MFCFVTVLLNSVSKPCMLSFSRFSNKFVLKSFTLPGFLEHVTVLIGISVREQAVGGVIHQPYWGGKAGGRTIWGLEGLGVRGLSPPSPSASPLVITTSRSHSNALVESCLEALKPDTVLRVGGAGYKVIQHYIYFY